MAAMMRAMSESLHKREVGHRLRMAIEALDLSQVEVVKLFDLSPSKLGNWLRGDHYPNPWFIRRFCDRYGITCDWIYRGVVSGAVSDVADALWKQEQVSKAD